jgi:hypothetical protein
MTSERDFTTADLASAGETSMPAAETSEQQEDSRLGPDQRIGGNSSRAVGGDPAPADRATNQPAASAVAGTDATAAPLFPAAEADQFREQWVAVQGQFVDEPRQAVEQADHLVAELMQRLATQSSETRAELERRWDGQENISTEELRLALTQYRSFFERLLQA